MYQSIPNEMKMYPQWIVWRYEDTESYKPTKVPYSPRNASLADVTNPATWGTFDEAVHTARSFPEQYAGIGFVLTENDPYTFIDLDDPNERNPDGSYKHADPAQIAQRQLKIYQEFESYAERSPSGNGLHIIVRGTIPSGRRRSSIEVYSDRRYMTMTGNVFRDAPIKDYSELVHVLWEQIGKGANAAAFYAGLEHAKHSDDEILTIARNAANSEKFCDLYDDGNWQKWNYPSQSEADMALVDIIAFYSENRQQVQKLFLSSKLGQRPKSRAQYRLNYMLNKCFDHMCPPVDIDGLRDQLNAALERRVQEQLIETNIQQVQNVAADDEPQVQMNEPEKTIYTVPPGLLGDIARFIYSQAVYPVPEIALAGAIGLMAGIAGRAYNVSKTGLNQYVLLLARTGTGKEAIQSGTSKLMEAIKQVVPASTEFIGPSTIASPQALIKHLSGTAKSFECIVGEFGMELQQMSAPNAPPHLAGLRRMLLDIFNKSGNTDRLGKSVYSDKEKNTDAIAAPAVTIMGESTPEKFYEGIHEGLISEGLLPRFTIIEYLGDRVAFNEHHGEARPPIHLLESLANLCANALSLNSHNRVVDVGWSAEAEVLMRQFRDYCDGNMIGITDDVTRNLWNRCYIKALKLAALIAVGCDLQYPSITVEHANWAINLVLADCHNIKARFERGEVGSNNEEHQQLTRTMKAFKDYVVTPFNELGSYGKATTQPLHGNRIVTYSYIHQKLAQVSVFRKDKMNATFAIKRALKTLIERGDIQEINKATAAKEHLYNGVCYMMTNIKAFGL